MIISTELTMIFSGKWAKDLLLNPNLKSISATLWYTVPRAPNNKQYNYNYKKIFLDTFSSKKGMQLSYNNLFFLSTSSAWAYQCSFPNELLDQEYTQLESSFWKLLGLYQ